MKKTFAGVMVALLGIVVCGYVVLDGIFPKAGSIKLPDTESIAAIILTQKEGGSVEAEAADFGEILENIANAQPTRVMSVNDCPAANTYYTIEVDAGTRQYRYFLYSENSQTYIEIPYVGIYKTSPQFLHFVAEYFESPNSDLSN